MTTYWELRGSAVVWPGVMSRSLMVESQVQAGNYLADMAAKGNWQRVMGDLDPDNHLVDVNQWRPGDKSWTTALQEAARLGAPLEVVSWLLHRGALRSQTDADGRTAYDVAKQHGHATALLDLLAPPPSPMDLDRIQLINGRLADIMDGYIQQVFEGQDPREAFRYPPVGVLHEVAGYELWLQLPPTSGGLRITLQRGYIDALIGYRSFTPSGAVDVRTWGYIVTPRGHSLVYEGFVSTPGEPDSNQTARDVSGDVLKWRQVSDWWQADRVDVTERKARRDATTYRVYRIETDYELWAWPGPTQGGQAWARRLSHHAALDDAIQAATSHMAETSDQT